MKYGPGGNIYILGEERRCIYQRLNYMNRFILLWHTLQV